MINIVIIGSGNVASHLIKAFAKSEVVEVIQVFSRKNNFLSDFLPSEKITNIFSNIKEADLYILAVSDSAIEEVSKQLLFKNKLVVHTSGAVNLDAISNSNRRGVFYPLQTFSKNKEVNFQEIPICIEAENEEDIRVLHLVAKSISQKVYDVDSNQRKALHVSAVFVNNFTNYMYQIGETICSENNIDFQIVQPLIIETVNKINTLSPKEAQTGPAKRGDTNTINNHLEFLRDSNFKEIYKLLTKSIIDDGKKL